MPNTNKPELATFNGQTSDVLTSRYRYTQVFEVTSAAAVQLLPTSGKFTRVGIQNSDENTGAIFIGGEDVENDSVALSDGSKRGRKLKVGGNRDEDTTLAPWAIAGDGFTCFVIVEFAL